MIRIGYRSASNPRGDCSAKKVLIGIPLTGEVSLGSVRPSRSHDSTGDGSCERRLAQEIASLGDPGFLRNQRVVALTLYDEGVVDLVLPEADEPAVWNARNDAAEGLYAAIVLNYEQARKWRRRRSPGGRSKPLVQKGEEIYKLIISRSGIHRVTGADLERAGLQLGDVDSRHIAMSYGGGRPLPLDLNGERGGGGELHSVKILVEDGGDGRFDQQDAIVFYGEALSRWEFDEEEEGLFFLQNPYSRENVYWLTVDSETGVRGTVRSGKPQRADVERVTSYSARIHQEVERFPTFVAEGNIQSGSEWYWRAFSPGDEEIFTQVIRSPAGGRVDVRVRFAYQLTSETRRLLIRWNGHRLGTAIFDLGGKSFEFLAGREAVEGINELVIEHQFGTQALFDWYELEFERELTAERGELTFDTSAEAGLFEFDLSGFETERPRLFEVSGGVSELIEFDYDSSAGRVTFQDSVDSAALAFVVLVPSRMRAPDRIEKVTPAHLRESESGADYVIITHSDFMQQAERLAAWRGEDERFGAPPKTRVVDVGDIYNEFSAGLFDPTAIRNFLKHTTEHWDPVPFFVLLLGDGSYDYKNNSGTSTGNWIPPFEAGTLTYDDWYVSVIGNDRIPDMAVGRLPVQTKEDASTVADKLIDYDRDPEFGGWQSRILLAADDVFNADDRTKTETEFAADAEDLALRFFPDNADVEKFYLLEFPREGRFKPSARDAFIERFNDGSVLLVYIGHGNARVLAHEHFFALPGDLAEVDNGRRLPLLFAAASQTAVFDDPLRDSIPEALLKWRSGGVIGMIGSTRVGFHDFNMELARSFHAQMFRTGRPHLPVGQALMEAKSTTDVEEPSTILRYGLFGDPLMRLALPALGVELDTEDTLRALSVVHVTGRVTSGSGGYVDAFTGQVRLQVFDSTTLRRSEDKGETVEYLRPGAPIFRGVFPVSEGRFAADFLVPKDITYGGNSGRVSAYVWDGAQTGFGTAGPLALIGTEVDIEQDETGPTIEIGFAGQDFADGDFVPAESVLHAVLRDPAGINVTGEIGHKIQLRIDDELRDVTSRYEATGDFTRGAVVLQLQRLDVGEHELQLEAWDNFNNWSAETVTLKVGSQTGATIDNVLFYPNPMRKETGFFTFVLAQDAQVKVRVFALSGKLVSEFEHSGQTGYNQIPWKPEQLASGSYLYKITALSNSESADRTGAIQVLR